MIYVCVPSYNNADTVGLLLWKVRKVFAGFPREYHFLVVDDGSTDGTPAFLEPYEEALPLSVFRHETRRGYAATLERLFREALDRSDRPRRDCAITLPADFSVSPEVMPDLIKRIESGIDVVVGETSGHDTSIGMRLVRRWAPRLLQPGLHLRNFHDVLSGVYAFRLITLRTCLHERQGAFLDANGVLANAELIARTASGARQLAATPVAARRGALTHEQPFSLALQLLRAGRRLRVPVSTVDVQRG